ncbi:uncharacterized protein LOC141637215 [Silene latifolia]|uniref:uncharacterized protein LOC141637215 n=1 Tax=Silene latifolia TaxID=37657 RepID=UPI003D774DBF
MVNDYCCNIFTLGNPQKSLEDLNNEMLLEIFYRLPYITALGCKTVSKRWCSLISDPSFITQGLLAHRKINKKEPSLAFLLTLGVWGEPLVTAMDTPPYFQRTLSLEFLPYNSRPVATFKDLILSFGFNPLTRLDVFYISNPLTKKWMVLPPNKTHLKLGDWPNWAALTYLEGRGFRVVVAYPYSNDFPRKLEGPSVMVNLLVYISETCQWRDIDVRVQSQPTIDGYSGGVFSGIVCKQMVCIHIGKYFGAFNPFDVTDNFHGSLTAIDLPLPPGDVKILLESDGKLIAFEDNCCLAIELHFVA